MTSLSNLNDDVLDIVCALANEADHVRCYAGIGCEPDYCLCSL